jgi:hypothetical protein
MMYLKFLNIRANWELNKLASEKSVPLIYTLISSSVRIDGTFQLSLKYPR